MLSQVRSGGMLPWENVDFTDPHVCILRCFKTHLDNNIGLKPSQWAVVASIIFQDNRFLNVIELMLQTGNREDIICLF